MWVPLRRMRHHHKRLEEPRGDARGEQLPATPVTAEPQPAPALRLDEGGRDEGRGELSE